MSIFKSSIFEPNVKYKEDGLVLLKCLNGQTIASCFFDPQYRGLLDKMKYGNEGKARQAVRCNLPQMDNACIRKFILEIDRVLKDSGHLFLWVDKFHLCSGIQEWLIETKLKTVDMIVWNKLKMGMGYRTRKCSEYLVVLQKEPVRAKGVWNDHAIKDVWDEKQQRDHPHSKPMELEKRLITATTIPEDFVLDPAAGGFSVCEACKQTGRNFIGCDIMFGDIEATDSTSVS